MIDPADIQSMSGGTRGSKGKKSERVVAELSENQGNMAMADNDLASRDTCLQSFSTRSGEPEAKNADC